jgi:hypothetical protein
VASLWRRARSRVAAWRRLDLPGVRSRGLRPGFDALLRAALDESPALFRADALERSLVAASASDDPNPHE